MKKALLEEHVRYGEARFIDKELVRPFVNRIYQDLAEIEAVMKHKTCDGCKSLYINQYDEWSNYCKELNIEISDSTTSTFYCNRYEPKDNA